MVGDPLDDRPAARVDAPHVRAGGASRSAIVVEIGNLVIGPSPVGRGAIGNAVAPVLHICAATISCKASTRSTPLPIFPSLPGASNRSAPSPPRRDTPRTQQRPAEDAEGVEGPIESKRCGLRRAKDEPLEKCGIAEQRRAERIDRLVCLFGVQVTNLGEARLRDAVVEAEETLCCRGGCGHPSRSAR